MGAWIGDVHLSNAPDGAPDAWVVEEHLAYQRDDGLRVTVLPGARTDGASIPRLIWVMLGPPIGGKSTAAAVVHDTLYRTHGACGRLTRAECDAIFRRGMRDSGVKRRHAWAMWAGVRLFGWVAWINASLDQIGAWEHVLEITQAPIAAEPAPDDPTP